MAITGISAAQPSNAQAVLSFGQHKRGHGAQSISNVDATSSGTASAPSPTGKPGSKVNITA